MNNLHAAALMCASLVLVSCEKDEEPMAPEPYTQEWTLWTVPLDQSPIRVFVNGSPVEIMHSNGELPFAGFMPYELQGEYVHYPVFTQVRRNDQIRVEAHGRHEILLTTVRMFTTDGDTTMFTVYPGSD